MKSFQEFVDEGKVKVGSSDPATSISLMKQARIRLKDLLSLSINEETAPLRFESAYECLKEAIHSFMSLDGYKPYSHEAIFSYAYDKKLLTESEVMRADRYRKIRNDINYRGETVSLKRAKKSIEFSKKIIKRLQKKSSS
ncbi:MAG: hypothetical protein ACOCRX_02580 [Candidatus Woesearchaeota archaeon]